MRRRPTDEASWRVTERLARLAGCWVLGAGGRVKDDMGVVRGGQGGGEERGEPEWAGCEQPQRYMDRGWSIAAGQMYRTYTVTLASSSCMNAR